MIRGSPDEMKSTVTSKKYMHSLMNSNGNL